MESELAARLAHYRDLRREVETNVLALATSVDGRQFEFQAPLASLDLRIGGYVVLETGAGDRFGQITSLEVTHTDAGEVGWSGDTSMTSRVVIRRAQGDGTLLDRSPAPFHDARVRPATVAQVRAWAEEAAPRRAVLHAGELLLAPGLAHGLDAGGFDRHTFLCGQSGSGKTYALGVLLEQLLLETSLRIVVLDPNSDFARIAEVRPGVEAALGARHADVTRGAAIHRGPSPGSERLRIRFGELGTAGRAAALRLDPIHDREEYGELAALLEQARPDALDELARVDRAGAAGLAQRARNLGVDRWGVWAAGDPGSTLDALHDPAVRCLVVDLGSLETRAEQALVAEAVLERLWDRRTRREPVLIVIDEAHNVCPAAPEDALTALATEHAVRIAAEGRKFGLYLLTSTQRPQKVHPNVVSQCDNLILMRMNSAADLAYAGEIFSFVPAGLLARARTFGLGEALVAGKLSSHPALVRMGPRISEEGGADVPSNWAERT
jgi:DNA helicase HerA-like ATPase